MQEGKGKKLFQCTLVLINKHKFHPCAVAVAAAAADDNQRKREREKA